MCIYICLYVYVCLYIHVYYVCVCTLASLRRRNVVLRSFDGHAFRGLIAFLTSLSFAVLSKSSTKIFTWWFSKQLVRKESCFTEVHNSRELHSCSHFAWLKLTSHCETSCSSRRRYQHRHFYWEKRGRTD